MVLRDKNLNYRKARTLLERGAGSRTAAEALGHLREALEAAEAVGLQSQYLLWQCAIAADSCDEMSAAADYIAAAVALDPLNPGVSKSTDIIFSQIQAALEHPGRADDDPSTPGQYQILVKHGETDVGAHVAMAKYLLATGDIDRARRLADATSTLYPGDPEVLDLKRRICVANDDAAGAEAAAVELAAVTAATWRRGASN